MQSQVRSHVAAILLLAPVAATLVAGPAFAQRAVVAPSSAIQLFEVRPSGRLEQGTELRFRVVGAPNARAFVEIPGVSRRFELSQVQAGVYEGGYTIRRRDQLDAFSEAIATLESGYGRATARADLRNVDREYGRGYGWGRDNRGPDIASVSPADGSRVVERDRTTISARLTDDGRGVDPGSVTLRVDGRDVTRNARIDGNEINYRDDLGRGRHTAELTVRDRAGNTARKAWSFEVIEPRDNGSNNNIVGSAPPNSPAAHAAAPYLQITGLANGAVVDLLRHPLVVQGRTMPNAEVNVVSEVLVSIMGGVDTRPHLTRNTRADANGFFSVVIDPPNHISMPVTNFDIRVRSNSGTLQAEETLRLRQRS